MSCRPVSCTALSVHSTWTDTSERPSLQPDLKLQCLSKSKWGSRPFRGEGWQPGRELALPHCGSQLGLCIFFSVFLELFCSFSCCPLASWLPWERGPVVKYSSSLLSLPLSISLHSCNHLWRQGQLHLHFQG